MSILDALNKKFPGAVTGSNLEAIDPWIEIAPASLVEVCTYLRDDAKLRFDYLSCISGVDYLHTDPKKAAKAGWEPHTEVVYHLWSTVFKHSIVLKVMLPRWKDDIEGNIPEVPTVSHVWRTADWHEREAFDLLGVRFLHHPDLRRILLPADWEGFPLRKDYAHADRYRGIEIKY